MFFLFHETVTTEIYTLSLHDALPIFGSSVRRSSPLTTRRGPQSHATSCSDRCSPSCVRAISTMRSRDRKSTRLNSSHANISYAVFCLKKKNKNGEKYKGIKGCDFGVE